MKKICVPLLVALAAGGLVPAALAVEDATAPTSAVVPPALQALEQKMAQIRFNSARFHTRTDFGIVKSSGSSNAMAAAAKSSEELIVNTYGVIGFSPSVQASTSTTDGSPLDDGPFRERRIGATIYSYDPSLARRDGGRPWIRDTRTRRDEKLAARVAPLTDLLHPLLAGLQRPAASTGPFVPLLEVLGQAQSARETGPATVDGQQTVGFLVTVSPAKLLAGLVASHLLKHGPPPGLRYPLELWFAPSGLPVRVAVLGSPGEGFSSQEDLLGIEVPVLVSAPPASETIDQTRLAKVERGVLKAVRRCERRRPHRAKACVKRLGG